MDLQRQKSMKGCHISPNQWDVPAEFVLQCWSSTKPIWRISLIAHQYEQCLFCTFYLLPKCAHSSSKIAVIGGQKDSCDTWVLGYHLGLSSCFLEHSFCQLWKGYNCAWTTIRKMHFKKCEKIKEKFIGPENAYCPFKKSYNLSPPSVFQSLPL